LKRVVTFSRSMTFGIILMILLMACSLAGSFLPQGQPAEFYIHNHPQISSVIIMLKLDNIFISWYFLLLLVLLCLNLTLCSVVRWKRVFGAHKALLASAQSVPAKYALLETDRGKLVSHLKSSRFSVSEFEDVQVFHKNAIGHFGSFIIHLSFVLLLLVGAGVLYFSKIEDFSVMPGQAVYLDGGISLNVIDFYIEDETGRLDFTSTIRADSENGATSGERQISVNTPLSFKNYKFYQQSYGTAGSITVYNTDTGGSDTFSLREPVFLTLDGRNGVWFEALHPGYIEDDDGHYTLITSTSGAYPDPIYQVLSMSDGAATPVLALPGETLQINEISYTFNDPIDFPGIRVKHTSPLLLGTLYGVFVMMIAGFWLCFFNQPMVVAVREDGYTLLGGKTTGLRLELDNLLESKSSEEDLP